MTLHTSRYTDSFTEEYRKLSKVSACANSGYRPFFSPPPFSLRVEGPAKRVSVLQPSTPAHNNNSIIATMMDSSSSGSEEEGEVLEVGENCVPQIELLKAVAQLKEEELVVKSSKGPLIVLVVDALLANSTAVEFKKFNDSIVKKMQSCLSANRKREISLTKLWKKFHDLRLSASTRSMWLSCIEILHLPEEVYLQFLTLYCNCF